MNEGILLVDKPAKMSSFSMVYAARKRLGVKKIGHGGTLDPFATGLIVLLVGKNYTRRASQFLDGDKEYIAKMRLGEATDSFDCEGAIVAESDKIPSLQEIEEVIASFQGTISQVPPMFSAKKINGVRLYEHARKGRVIEREPVLVHVKIEEVRYSYPALEFRVSCSKGTYIRALSDDIGKALGTFAHLQELRRTRSGRFTIDDCIAYSKLIDPNCEVRLRDT